MTQFVDALLGIPYPTTWRVPYNVSSIQVTTQPAVEPILLADAKLHLRVTTTDQDSLIEQLIVMARAYTEMVCQRALINQVWQVTFDRFETPLKLPGGNINAITSLTYLDINGASQSLVANTGYAADLASFPARVFPALNTCWPVTGCLPAAVTAVYSLGYGPDGTTVPAPLIAAMKLMIGDNYENREGHIPTRYFVVNDNVENLLMPFKRIEP